MFAHLNILTKTDIFPFVHVLLHWAWRTYCKIKVENTVAKAVWFSCLMLAGVFKECFQSVGDTITESFEWSRHRHIVIDIHIEKMRNIGKYHTSVESIFFNCYRHFSRRFPLVTWNSEFGLFCTLRLLQLVHSIESHSIVSRNENSGRGTKINQT